MEQATKQWVTVRRIANELGVSATWLERFCNSTGIVIREATNPYYRSSAPMRLVERNELSAVLGEHSDELAAAQKRSAAGRKAVATTRSREETQLDTARREFEDMARVVESFGSLETALFWLGALNGTVTIPTEQAWSLLGGCLASGGRLTRSSHLIIWQLPSGIEIAIAQQMVKEWGWTTLLPEAKDVVVHTGANVVLRAPFGRERKIRVVKVPEAYKHFQDAVVRWMDDQRTIAERTWGAFSALGSEDCTWAKLSFSPHEAAIWRQAGIDPYHALVCIASGIGVSEASELTLFDLDVIRNAILVEIWRGRLDYLRSWMNSGFNARDAVMWDKVLGVPELASMWRNLGVHPSSAALLSGFNRVGYQVSPEQFATLLAQVCIIRGGTVKGGDVAEALLKLIAVGIEVPLAEKIIVQLYTHKCFNNKCIENITELAFLKVPARIASELAIRIEKTTPNNRSFSMSMVAEYWRAMPNEEPEVVLDWVRARAGSEMVIRLRELGITPAQFVSHRQLFKSSKESVLTRLEKGENLADILASPPPAYEQWCARRRARKERKQRRRAAARARWAMFFDVPVTAVPQGIGGCTAVAREAYRTGRASVPASVLEAWRKQGSAPSWARQYR